MEDEAELEPFVTIGTTSGEGDGADSSQGSDFGENDSRHILFEHVLGPPLRSLVQG